MANITTKQGVLFKGISKKFVAVHFDQKHASSNGISVLLKTVDDRLHLGATLATCLSDTRQQSKGLHSRSEFFQQRMHGIACGYEDANESSICSVTPR